MRNAPKRILMGKSYVLFRVVRIPRRMIPRVRLRVCMRIILNVLSINAMIKRMLRSNARSRMKTVIGAPIRSGVVCIRM